MDDFSLSDLYADVVKDPSDAELYTETRCTFPTNFFSDQTFFPYPPPIMPVDKDGPMSDIIAATSSTPLAPSQIQAPPPPPSSLAAVNSGKSDAGKAPIGQKPSSTPLPNQTQNGQKTKTLHSSLGDYTVPDNVSAQSNNTANDKTSGMESLVANEVSNHVNNVSDDKSEDEGTVTAPPSPPPSASQTGTVPKQQQQRRSKSNQAMALELSDLQNYSRELQIEQNLVAWRNLHGDFEGDPERTAQARKWAEKRYADELAREESDSIRRRRTRRRVKGYEAQPAVGQIEDDSDPDAMETVSGEELDDDDDDSEDTGSESENEDTCRVCGDEGFDGNALFCCDFCPNSYHFACAKDKQLNPTSETAWRCPECMENDEDDLEMEAEAMEEWEQEIQVLDSRTRGEYQALLQKLETLLRPLLSSSGSHMGTDDTQPPLDAQIIDQLKQEDLTLLQRAAGQFHQEEEEEEEDTPSPRLDKHLIPLLQRHLVCIEREVAKGNVDPDDIAIDTTKSEDVVTMEGIAEEIKAMPTDTAEQQTHHSGVKYLHKYLKQYADSDHFDPMLFREYVFLTESCLALDGFFPEDLVKAKEFIRKVVLKYPDGKSVSSLEWLLKHIPKLKHDRVPQDSNNNNNNNNNNISKDAKPEPPTADVGNHDGSSSKVAAGAGAAAAVTNMQSVSTSSKSKSATQKTSKGKNAAAAAAAVSSSAPDSQVDLPNLKELICWLPVAPSTVHKGDVNKSLAPQAAAKEACGSGIIGDTGAVMISKCRHVLRPDSRTKKWTKTPNKQELSAAIEEATRKIADNHPGRCAVEEFVKQYIGWALWKPDSGRDAPTWVYACLRLAVKKKRPLLVLPNNLMTKVFPAAKDQSPRVAAVKEAAVTHLIESFDPAARSFSWMPTWNQMQSHNMTRTAHTKDKVDATVKQLPTVDSRRVTGLLRGHAKTIHSRVCEILGQQSLPQVVPPPVASDSISDSSGTTTEEEAVEQEKQEQQRQQQVEPKKQKKNAEHPDPATAVSNLDGTVAGTPMVEVQKWFRLLTMDPIPKLTPDRAPRQLLDQPTPDSTKTKSNGNAKKDKHTKKKTKKKQKKQAKQAKQEHSATPKKRKVVSKPASQATDVEKAQPPRKRTKTDDDTPETQEENGKQKKGSKSPSKAASRKKRKAVTNQPSSSTPPAKPAAVTEAEPPRKRLKTASTDSTKAVELLQSYEERIRETHLSGCSTYWESIGPRAIATNPLPLHDFVDASCSSFTTQKVGPQPDALIEAFVALEPSLDVPHPELNKIVLNAFSETHLSAWIDTFKTKFTREPGILSEKQLMMAAGKLCQSTGFRRSAVQNLMALAIRLHRPKGLEPAAPYLPTLAKVVNQYLASHDKDDEEKKKQGGGGGDEEEDEFDLDAFDFAAEEDADDEPKEEKTAPACWSVCKRGDLAFDPDAIKSVLCVDNGIDATNTVPTPDQEKMYPVGVLARALLGIADAKRKGAGWADIASRCESVAWKQRFRKVLNPKTPSDQRGPALLEALQRWDEKEQANAACLIMGWRAMRPMICRFSVPKTSL